MFAVRSVEPVRVDRAFEGLKRLAVEHKDGWGVARFDGKAPWLETSVRRADGCERFGALGVEIATTSLLAHIRLASVGSVTEQNSHPFFADGWAFMHNGTLKRFAEHRPQLEQLLSPERRAALRGDTDSERCFGLFLTLLAGRSSLDDVTRSLVGVMRAVEKIFPEASMNFIASDGQRLVATRRGRTLYTAQRAGARFVASEHLWDDETWQSVPEEGVVAIDADLSMRQSTVTDWA
jgi:glutamine amidotransferase